jgi:two-component system response regulator AtoC
MIEYGIHVIDDETLIRDSIAMALEETYRIETFAEAEPAIKAMEKDPPDLVLLDIGLPGMDGIQALEKIQKRHPGLLTVMITAVEDIDTVVAAMRLGAYDYVVKPLQMDGLETTIRNALETIRLRKEVRSLQRQVLQANVPCFIAESDVIQDVMAFVGQVAKSPDTPVLIQGGTGTGKELIASAIHYQSPNFQGPFITVNCAAIPADLVESELFGYEKGAFSGAGAAGKRGLLEAAGGGTLFLDEIGDLSPDAQAKLLRFLEQGEFFRVGGTRRQILNTRIISATNKDLERMIADGRFRKDLYFRIGVVKVKIPALNARTDDILPLARHFLVEFENKFGKGLHRVFSCSGDGLDLPPLDRQCPRTEKCHRTGRPGRRGSDVDPRQPGVGPRPRRRPGNWNTGRCHGIRTDPAGRHRPDRIGKSNGTILHRNRPGHGRRQREPGRPPASPQPSHLPLPP